MATIFLCYYTGEVIILVHKKKRLCLGDETKIVIVDGPSNFFTARPLNDKESREFTFSVKFGKIQTELCLLVFDIVPADDQIQVYFGKATSEQVDGRFILIYDAEHCTGYIEKDFDKRLN